MAIGLGTYLAVTAFTSILGAQMGHQQAKKQQQMADTERRKRAMQLQQQQQKQARDAYKKRRQAFSGGMDYGIGGLGSIASSPVLGEQASSKVLGS